jgi:hypothetical protein
MIGRSEARHRLWIVMFMSRFASLPPFVPRLVPVMSGQIGEKGEIWRVPRGGGRGPAPSARAGSAGVVAYLLPRRDLRKPAGGAMGRY